ncbi:MAG: prepilin-type N-terminal cleavage/methylation domain-containing protein [Christensenella sp.]
MKTRTNKHKKGFTLIELIIVIAIIAILVSLLVPSLISVAKDSENSTCVNYRDTVLTQFASETVNNPNYRLSAFLKKEKLTCPFGGAYTGLSAAGSSFILCSLHKDDSEHPIDSTTLLPATMYDQMLDLYDLYITLPPKEQQALAGWGNNSDFRKALSKMYYGGTWPQLPAAFLEANNMKAPMYIQPFINVNKTANTAEVTIFAKPTDGDGWFTSLVYDHEEGVWYKPIKSGGVSVTQPWSKIKKTIHDSSKWMPIKM